MTNCQLSKIRNGILRVAVFVLVLGLFMPVKVFAANTLFADVPDDSRYFSAISYLKNMGVAKGYSDMTFKPSAPITRAEFLKLLISHAEAKKTLPKKVLFETAPEFSDVKSNEWFAEYIKKAAILGIVKGYSDNTFKPTDTVKLSEALKMLFLSHDLKVPTIHIKDSPFPDVRVGSWILPYAKFAWNRNIVLMDGDGKLHADKVLTREYASELIYRLSIVSSKQLSPFDLSTEWTIYTDLLQNFLVKIPFDWQIINEGARAIIWHQDKVNGQIDYEYISPLAAKIIIRPVNLSEDDLKPGVYFEKMKQFSKQVFPENEINFSEVKIGEQSALYVSVPSKNIHNWYILVKSSTKALMVYSQIGNGSLLKQNETIMNFAVATIKPILSGLSEAQQAEIEKMISDINAAINIEGKAKEILMKITDRLIIETDAIGIGTGPIDYYYSKKLNVSIKVERASNTILGVRGGKTTKF